MSNRKVIDVRQINTAKTDTSEATVQEYLSKDSVKINGKLPFASKTTNLYDILGKPDSIVSPNLNDICVSYYSWDFKYAYFGHSQFEVYGDTSVLGSINFNERRKLELRTSNLNLNSETTLAELGRVFPNSVKDQYELDVMGIGKTVAVQIAI